MFHLGRQRHSKRGRARRQTQKPEKGLWGADVSAQYREVQIIVIVKVYIEVLPVRSGESLNEKGYQGHGDGDWREQVEESLAAMQEEVTSPNPITLSLWGITLKQSISLGYCQTRSLGEEATITLWERLVLGDLQTHPLGWSWPFPQETCQEGGWFHHRNLQKGVILYNRWIRKGLSCNF